METRREVYSVRSIFDCYEIQALFAEYENDRDVAHGHALTGPGLDAVEKWDRELHEAITRAETELLLYGEARLLVDR